MVKHEHTAIGLGGYTSQSDRRDASTSERRIIHLVHDGVHFRLAISKLLEEVGYEVWQWPDGPSLLREAASVPKGCVLLDLGLPGLDGLNVLRFLHATTTGLPVIMLSENGDIPTVVAAMRAGAVDFLRKPLVVPALISAIERSLVGEKQALAGGGASILASLTRREQEVLRAITLGLSNKAIARNLAISPRTVESHRARIMAKFKVNSIASVLRIALGYHSGHGGGFYGELLGSS